MENPIIERIRKLHALAERAGTEAEAANAAARVQELLAKHNLEIGEVVLKEDPGQMLEVGKRWRRIPSHAFSLVDACRDLFDILSYFQGRRRWGWRFVFIGLKANVEAAAITYEYLMESVDSLARGAKADNLIYGSHDFMAFRSGASRRIREIARSQKEQTLAANPAYAQLVHIGNSVARTMHNAIVFDSRPGPGGFGGWGGIGTNAYARGYEQGGRVDLRGAQTSRMLK